MVQKLRDAANMIKAKLTQDNLEELLINVTTEENWQASTNDLSEIANYAYSYEKWQQISDFIREKLTKSKSWKKILKTLNLVEYLLKNGHPRIIGAFKYDIYQFRGFESFTHVSESQNIQRGEPIRERAKAIVNLLTHEEILEEERVKAKAIREKMAGVVGRGNQAGTSSGMGSGYGGSNLSGGGRYDGFDSKTKKSTDYGGNSLASDEGYNYPKSNLDKYKDPAARKTPSTTNWPATKDQEPVKDQKETLVTKEPFKSIAPKLIKPGEKQIPLPPPATKVETQTAPQRSIVDDDIFSFSTPTQPAIVPQQPVVQPVQFVAPPVQTQQQGGFTDLGFSFEPQRTAPIQSQPQHGPQPIPTQPAQNQQLPFNQGYPGMGMQAPYMQPNMAYPMGNMAGGMMLPNPYTQNININFNPGVFPAQPQYGANMMYPNMQPQGFSAPPARTMQPQANQISLSGGVNLSTKKEDDQFGNFESAPKASNSNVKWLSSQQKGLIDFSDFGSQIKAANKAPAPKSGQINNNIDTTWNW